MIKREKYLQAIRPFYDDDMIKIITGIRRSGKSVILEQIMQEVKEKTDSIIYLNFEDRAISGQITNCDELLDYVKNHSKEDTKTYIFLDEVQELSDWEKACKSLRLHNNSVFITGSNSKLLSGEFAKELSGRYVSFRVRPFVYKEITEYAKELENTISITDYLIWGGFPKRFEYATEEDQRKYLSDLDETIVLNDLLQRYNIRKPILFRKLVNYVLRNNGRIFSAASVRNYIKQELASCSINTVMNYLSYLKEAFIINEVKLYSPKVKKELSYYAKLYNGDVAFNSLRCFNKRYDLTHNLENIVYNELVYMGYEIYVYDNAGKEIDFLCSKNGKQYFVQVAYSVAEDKAYEREFSAFKNLDGLSQRIIITNDELDYSTSMIRHIKLKDFLLMEDL